MLCLFLSTSNLTTFNGATVSRTESKKNAALLGDGKRQQPPQAEGGGASEAQPSPVFVGGLLGPKQQPAGASLELSRLFHPLPSVACSGSAVWETRWMNPGGKHVRRATALQVRGLQTLVGVHTW